MEVSQRRGIDGTDVMRRNLAIHALGPRDEALAKARVSSFILPVESLQSRQPGAPWSPMPCTIIDEQAGRRPCLDRSRHDSEIAGLLTLLMVSPPALAST